MRTTRRPGGRRVRAGPGRQEAPGSFSVALPEWGSPGVTAVPGPGPRPRRDGRPRTGRPSPTGRGAAGLDTHPLICRRRAWAPPVRRGPGVMAGPSWFAHVQITSGVEVPHPLNQSVPGVLPGSTPYSSWSSSRVPGAKMLPKPLIAPESMYFDIEDRPRVPSQVGGEAVCLGGGDEGIDEHRRPPYWPARPRAPRCPGPVPSRRRACGHRRRHRSSAWHALRSSAAGCRRPCRSADDGRCRDPIVLNGHVCHGG